MTPLLFLSYRWVEALSGWLCLHVHYKVTMLLQLLLTNLFKEQGFLSNVKCNMFTQMENKKMLLTLLF